MAENITKPTLLYILRDCLELLWFLKYQKDYKLTIFLIFTFKNIRFNIKVEGFLQKNDIKLLIVFDFCYTRIQQF